MNGWLLPHKCIVWRPVTRRTWANAVRPQGTFGGQFTDAEMENPFVIATESVEISPRLKTSELYVGGWVIVRQRQFRRKL